MKLHHITAVGLAIAAAAALSSCGSDGPPVETTAQGLIGRPAPAEPPIANEFHLSGESVFVVYAPFAEAGRPVLTYTDDLGSWTFHRDDIETIATNAGTLVSALRPIDGNASNLTLLVPRTQLAAKGGAFVQTIVIVTARQDHSEGRTQALRTTVYGQLDTYRVTPIWGIATHAEKVVIPTTGQ